PRARAIARAESADSCRGAELGGEDVEAIVAPDALAVDHEDGNAEDALLHAEHERLGHLPVVLPAAQRLEERIAPETGLLGAVCEHGRVVDLAALAPARAEYGVAVAALLALRAGEVVAGGGIRAVDGDLLRRLPGHAELAGPARRVLEQIAQLELRQLRREPGGRRLRRRHDRNRLEHRAGPGDPILHGPVRECGERGREREEVLDRARHREGSFKPSISVRKSPSPSEPVAALAPPSRTPPSDAHRGRRSSGRT